MGAAGGRPAWSRLRLAVDAMILSVTIALSLLAGPAVDRSYSESWVALLFGIAVLAMLHARPAPDDRLNASSLGDLQQRARHRVAGLDAHHLHRLDPRREPSGGVGHAAVAVHRGLPRRRPHLPGDQPARGDPPRGPGHPDAHRRRRHDRLAPRPPARSPSRPTACGRSAISTPTRCPTPSRATRAQSRCWARPDDLEEAIASTGARHVILSFSNEPDHVLVEKVRQCQALGVNVSLVPRLYESINERATLDHVGGLPLLTLHTVDPKGWQFAVKHALDRSAALLRAPHPVAGARGDRRRRQADLAGPGALPPAARRSRRAHVRRAQVPHDDRERPRRPSFELGDGLAPGGVEGLDRRTPVGPRPARPVARRAAPALQRPARRHESRRPAPGASRVRGALRSRRRALRRSSPRKIGHHRLGPGPRATVARPRSPTGWSGTTTTSRTGRSGSICASSS